MSNLDRFSVSKEWEQKFLIARVMSVVRFGSNHSPLLLENGVDAAQCRRFRFENDWLTKPTFRKKMIERWPKWQGEENSGVLEVNEAA
jgi:hypothetical protein